MHTGPPDPNYPVCVRERAGAGVSPLSNTVNGGVGSTLSTSSQGCAYTLTFLCADGVHSKAVTKAAGQVMQELMVLQQESQSISGGCLPPPEALQPADGDDGGGGGGGVGGGGDGAGGGGGSSTSATGSPADAPADLHGQQTYIEAAIAAVEAAEAGEDDFYD